MSKLSRHTIFKNLNADVVELISDFTVLNSVDSTNLELNRLGVTDKFKICIADTQTAGKGRKGNKWLSPAGNNIYFSISKRFAYPADGMMTLGLVVGILVASTLNTLYKINSIKLKWPNDLIAKDKKLGGILVENQPHTKKQSDIVIGIGINVSMQENPDVPWINLQAITEGASREKTLSALLNNLIPELVEFNPHTLKTLLPIWNQLDWTKNTEVVLFSKSNRIQGKSLGIADDGGLLLKTENGIKKFHSGDLSLRKNHVTA